MLTSVPDRATYGNAATSRGRSTPVLEADQRRRTGYDTLGVVADVRGEGLAFRSSGSHLDRSTGVLTPRSERAYETLACGVALQSKPDQPGRVYFECSVPRLVNGSNVSPATAAEVLQAVYQVRDEGAALVDWLDPPETWRLTRVDCVRDMPQVKDLSGLLSRLASVPRPATTAQVRYNEPRGGHWQSLAVRVAQRWQVTAYDKGAERLHAARRADHTTQPRLMAEALVSRDQLRVEVGLRHRVLRDRLDVVRVMDVSNEELLMGVAESYFKRSGMGTEVGGPSKVFSVLSSMLASPDERKMADRLVGMLVIESLGLDQPASDNTLDKHMALARRYGLTPADLTVEDGPSRRIDWRTSSVVEGAA